MMLQRYSNGFMGDPLSFVADVRRHFDEVFGREPFGGVLAGPAFAVGPRFESRKTETGVVLTAELPGVKADDVDVKVEGRTLTVSGRRTTDAPEGYETVRRERAELRFTRTFSLGDRFDPESVEAEMQNGILTLTLSLRPEAKPKVIDVKAS